MPAENLLMVCEDMTIYHALDLKQRLMAALEAHNHLELDLSQVSEIDTAGLQLLILTKREVARLNKMMTIVAHSPAVQQIIDFCQLTAFFGDPVVITVREQG